MLSMRPLAIRLSNQPRMPSRCRLTVRAAFFIGSSRDRIAQLYQRSRNRSPHFQGRLIVDLLECDADPISSSGFEVHAGERVERCAALGG